MGPKWVGMTTGKIYEQKCEAFLELVDHVVTRKHQVNQQDNKVKISAAELEQYGLLPDGVGLIHTFLKDLEIKGVIAKGSLHIAQRDVTNFDMEGCSIKYLSFEIVPDKYQSFSHPKDNKSLLTYTPKIGLKYKTKRVISFQKDQLPGKLFEVLWRYKVARNAVKEICEMAAKTKQQLIEESGYAEKGGYRSAPSYRRRELDGLLRNSINRWNHIFEKKKVPAHIEEIEDLGFVLMAQCD